MTYPDPRYHGDTGEVTARFRPAATEPELTTVTGTCSYLATGATTDGAFGLYRWEMGPEPSGAGAHFHRTMTESFYVLSGVVRVFDGTSWIDANVGDFLHVPVGGLHGFRNESGAPASMLILFTPGAPREAYFEGLVEAATSGREIDPQEWAEFLVKHDNNYV